MTSPSVDIARDPDPIEPPPDLPLRASETIQGNILAGFLKDYQVFLFLGFLSPDAGRAWLRDLIPHIATTRAVASFNARYSKARRARPGDTGDSHERLKQSWVNVGLTAHGILTLAEHLAEDLVPFTAFRAGPAARANALGDDGDSAPEMWVVGRPGTPPVDAILTIAADTEDDLEYVVAEQEGLLPGRCLEVACRAVGASLAGGREHFGFKDGVSQPGIFGFHPVDDEARPVFRLGHPGTRLVLAGRFILESPGKNPRRPVPAWMKDGSFQVFRRLAQDVPGWWAQVAARQQSLLGDPMSVDLLAAKLVGRWPSGQPLALSAAEKQDPGAREGASPRNDFTFAADPQGQLTPHFAHIRKLYPRDTQGRDDRRRILRRGIPFGPPFTMSNGWARGVDTERGLLFNAFMASIEEQFEFLQAVWASNPNFPEAGDGPDPMIGNHLSPVNLRRRGHPDVLLDFRRFVRTTGAVYAFAPSLTTVRDLAVAAL